MPARIYQRPKNAMQSGRARTREWVLEFLPTDAQRADSMMGWAGSRDTRRQITLTFDSEASARAYADKAGIICDVIATPVKTLKLQSYADNFR